MRDSWCDGYDCTKCYKYLNCWSCAKADVENNKTCGELKVRKKRVDCFVCDMEHPELDTKEEGQK